MAKRSFQQDLEQKATRAILIRSIYRWESAAVIAFVMILLTAAYLLSGAWQPWHWLVLGVGLLGEVGLVWSSLKDPEFRARAVAEMFREKYNARQIRNDALRHRVEKALEYRDRIDEVIAGSREGVLRDHMADAGQGITNWMENVFRLAKRLDAYMADEMLRQDLQSVDPEIENLKRRLGREDSDEVKRQISQTIAQKQIQRDNLRKLQNVMERAQFQLESTITAMGTVYSQMMILGSRDVASGRAQRLQQDITDQVQALQDVVHTMDEVYQVGTDPLALDLSGVDLAALDALDAGGQTAQKGTGGG
jgi:hypothetical protein